MVSKRRRYIRVKIEILCLITDSDQYVSEVIMGNVLSAGQGQSPAWQAFMLVGLPV
ncbi:hypothetical protein [Syntrophotalea acetylenivorans]|uniref:hypothetical protein n=1 Tax=Syntrophotalea acetylenivorans TaxID=1842532 RepID=UPI000ACF7DED|nr:hypothetical protein [Syntrophotalea acetylenivorans]